MAECAIIEYICKKNTFNAYISPTYSQGRKVYKELVEMLEPTGIVKKANSSTLTIETIYGSTFQAFSMDSPTSIRGYTVTGLLVLDECSFFPDELPDGSDPWSSVIMPITKARKPRVLMISTPKGKRGFFYSMYMKALNKEEGFKQVTATIYDDELVTKEEIEQIKKTISPVSFDEEFCCKFMDSSITVFPGFETTFDRDFEEGKKVWLGIDPSTVGDDDTILTAINEHNQVRQHKIEGTLDQKYSKIATLINSYNPVATYIESNSIGVPMYNEIKKQLDKKANFQLFTTTNETKKQYISLISVAVANNAIHFEKSNSLLYGQMGTFTYSITKAGNVTYAAKAGFHDDTITSLGIAMQCKEDNPSTKNYGYILRI